MSSQDADLHIRLVKLYSRSGKYLAAGVKHPQQMFMLPTISLSPSVLLLVAYQS